MGTSQPIILMSRRHIGVSNHWQLQDLFNRWFVFWLTTQKHPKLYWPKALLALCDGNPPITTGLPSCRPSYAEVKDSISWLHHKPRRRPINQASFYISINYLASRLPSWASYQIRKIAGGACAGNAGNVFPRRRFQRKPLVSDPGMHHGTCVTHVPWCMSGSLTCGDGENVPGIPGACVPAILRIWQEAHPANYTHLMVFSLSLTPRWLHICYFYFMV